MRSARGMVVANVCPVVDRFPWTPASLGCVGTSSSSSGVAVGGVYSVSRSSAIVPNSLVEPKPYRVVLSIAVVVADRTCPVMSSGELSVKVAVEGQSYTKRVVVIAEALHGHLPDSFEDAWAILFRILGPENPNETGMFKYWYWLSPVAKFVELYGLDYPEIALGAIEEITKRSTGEYAIRPYIRMHTDLTLVVMKKWAKSDNFHLRRLASEGLRPKLPWATKLGVFIENPEPVFEILNILKEDEILFVKKSVANHLTDWLKVNYDQAKILIIEWQDSDNIHTKWIIKRATRKIGV